MTHHNVVVLLHYILLHYILLHYILHYILLNSLPAALPADLPADLPVSSDYTLCAGCTKYHAPLAYVRPLFGLVHDFGCGLALGPAPAPAPGPCRQLPQSDSQPMQRQHPRSAGGRSTTKSSDYTLCAGCTKYHPPTVITSYYITSYYMCRRGRGGRGGTCAHVMSANVPTS